MAYLMGIDIGTSSLKTLVTDESGHVMAQASEAYQFDSPHGGYAQQDPEVWWKACVRTIRKCLLEVKADEVKALSFSGQMHGAVLLDPDAQVIRPAILHNDARSSEQVRMLKEVFGTDGVRRLMMNAVYTGFLLPSLLWVRENERELYERVDKVCLPKDYLKLRLTGDLSSDISDASATLAYDVRNNCWSREILDALKVPVSFFPKLYQTADAVGHVSRKAAEETGLSQDTIVVAGGGDQVMQGIGNGVVTPGVASSNIGTAGQLSYRSSTPILNPDLTTNTFSSYRTDQWLIMGAIMNAGVTLKNMNQIGEAYHALYIISADAVFSVDLQQADISYSKDNSDIYISVPKPELELFLDQNSTEKLAETQNFSWTVSAQDGVIAYLNSMTNIIEKVKDSMANYDTLMETAENSARKQVESLASAVCGENQHIHVHFK